MDIKMLDKRGGLYPALFLSSIFLLSLFQIKSYDLWWHIKAGEMIIGAGLKPVPTNTFSWSEPEHPWVNFSRLFDVVVYLIHKAAGFNGLILFQAVLATAVFFLVYRTALLSSPLFNKEEARGRYEIFALFLIGYFAARFRFSLRPHLLALLFFAADIYLLNLYRAKGKNLLFLVPIIQLLWVNTHGSAILGVLLPGIFLGGGFLTLLLTLAVSFLNPYGYKVLTDPFIPFLGQGADIFRVLAVDEWQIPDKEMFFGWYGLLLAIGVASFLPFSLSLREREVDWTDLILFSTFALLSIKALRFIDLFVVAGVPVVYRNVVSGWKFGSSRPTSHILRLAILLLLWSIGFKDTTFTLGLGVNHEVIPKNAVEFMEKNRIQGKVFNSYNFGGYLIYRSYPVFIDGRLCYSPELVKEFADANLTVSGWRRLEERFKPDIVLVEYDKPAIPETLLTDKQNWALVYWDDLAMLFLRRGTFSEIIVRNEYSYLNPMDARGLPPAIPSSHRIKGDEQTILAEAQRRAKEYPESMRARILVGNLYLKYFDPGKAADEYRTVINSPATFGKAEAHNNLGAAYERMGEVRSAEMEYMAAARLDRAYPLPERNLGYLEMGRLRYIQALWHLERYLSLESNRDLETVSAVSKLRGYRDILVLRVFIGGGAILGILWVAERRLRRAEGKAVCLTF